MRTTSKRKKLFDEEKMTTKRDYVLDDASLIVAQLDCEWRPPYLQDLWHSHNAIELGFCCDGEGVIGIDGRHYHFSPGAVVIIPPGVMHIQHPQSGKYIHWRYLIINQRCLLGDSLQRNGSAVLQQLKHCFDDTWRKGVFFEPNEDAALLMRLIRDLFDNQDIELCQTAMMEATVYLVLSRMACRAMSPAICKRTATNLTPVEPALRLIGERYTGEIHIEELARACGMSESYFRKTFADLLSCAPLEYVNRYRIERAINRMRSSDERMINVAMSCGFSSIATFNRNFRHFTGQSPTEWKRKMNCDCNYSDGD